MLFILTGDIQIGKSRWLERLVGRLEDAGVECFGVISKGMWIESGSERANQDGFEKIGINSILLPEKDEFCFAKRLDLAKNSGFYEKDSQAGKIGLGWHISDSALKRVDDRFVALLRDWEEEGARGANTEKESEEAYRGVSKRARSFLIVDELGRLEIEEGMGLVHAMEVLSRGVSESFGNALVVARDIFADQVADMFADAWGGVRLISPDDASLKLVIDTVLDK